MPVSDLFSRAGITFWDCAHETNAGLMCDGYTRATGKMAMAIAQAGSTDGDKVREALEGLNGKYAGLIKTYDKPFTPAVHDAIGSNDYVWAQFIDNRIVPVGTN